MMLENAAKAALAGFCLVSTGPLFAQETPVQAQQALHAEPSATATGYRVDGTESGFQLVTHGLWVDSSPTLDPIQPALETASVRSGRAETGRRRDKSSTNFRRAAYLPQVYAAESRHNIPTGLLDALVWTESRYNPFAVSHAGAAGLGQLMPGTARELGVANRFDPAANISGAARYLRQMLDRFGLVHLAVAAYNAGPGAVERAGGIPSNGETPAYVRDVLRHWRF